MLIQQDSLACMKQRPSQLCISITRTAGMCHPSWFSCECWGFKLRSSCLHGEVCGSHLQSSLPTGSIGPSFSIHITQLQKISSTTQATYSLKIPLKQMLSFFHKSLIKWSWSCVKPIIEENKTHASLKLVDKNKEYRSYSFHNPARSVRILSHEIGEEKNVKHIHLQKPKK